VLGLVALVVVGATVLAGNVAAHRLRLAAPVVLLVGGVLLGFVPALRAVRLPSEAVLLLFLPALLFWESLTISLREIRSNLRGIVLNSTVLVLVTAAAVAVVAHALGLPWGPAWVLGAAVAPTDATAVGVLARLLPRRSVTVLRAESLINDGTALVIYGLAVGITVGDEEFGTSNVLWLLVLSYGGGIAAGLVTAWTVDRLQGRLDDPLQENLLALLGPFTAYLLAEVVEASAILAVVVYGLMRSQAAPRRMRADTRQQGQAFWNLSSFVLNGALFVLVGIELQAVVRDLSSASLARGLLAVAVISAVVVATRFVWLFTVPYLIRLLDRRPQQRLRRVSARGRVVSATAGFRGAVSLALALAVPETVDGGGPFPGRDLIVFVTAGVIVVTLSQGLLLPGVVRWARLPRDAAAVDERRLAETITTEEAYAALPRLAAELETEPAVVERTRQEFEDRLAALRAAAGEDDFPLGHDQQYAALRLALLSHKRTTLVRLRDERRIDDTVLAQVQTQLDIEEVRLSRREVAD
jgi:monovalent cation/hydrogen antiporter